MKASALVVVQARMSSSRLPGKVLEDIGGEPLLCLLLRRLRRAHTSSDLVVATSRRSDDDPIAACASKAGARVSRGPLADVLGRIAAAADGFTGPVVRVTADCPLIDAGEVDSVVRLFQTVPGCGYASNIEPRSVPDGCDVEVISSSVLARLDECVDVMEAREHVTTWLRDKTCPVRAVAPRADPALGALRWTVDVPDDLAFVRAVVERLGSARYDASIAAILTAIRSEPSLAGFGGCQRG